MCTHAWLYLLLQREMQTIIIWAKLNSLFESLESFLVFKVLYFYTTRRWKCIIKCCVCMTYINVVIFLTCFHEYLNLGVWCKGYNFYKSFVCKPNFFWVWDNYILCSLLSSCLVVFNAFRVLFPFLRLNLASKTLWCFCIGTVLWNFLFCVCSFSCLHNCLSFLLFEQLCTCL